VRMSGCDLERYYPGDAAWQRFAAGFLEEERDLEIRERVGEIVQDEDLAAVIVGLVHHRPVRWLQEEVPALGDRSPRSCLEDDTGRKRLKTMLMRMP